MGKIGNISKQNYHSKSTPVQCSQPEPTGPERVTLRRQVRRGGRVRQSGRISFRAAETAVNLLRLQLGQRGGGGHQRRQRQKILLLPHRLQQLSVQREAG